MARRARLNPHRGSVLSLLPLALALATAACGGAQSDDWYYHWSCHGDSECLGLNPGYIGQGTGTAGPIAGGQAGCNSLMTFGRKNWNIPPATQSCDQSASGSADPRLVSLVVTPADPTLAKGASLAFKATGTFADGSTGDVTGLVTWTAGTPSVAHLLNQVATADAPGRTAIIATSGSVSARTTLTVTPPALQAITVSPPNPTVAAGEPQAFTATGQWSDGTTEDLTGSATWSSSQPAVASIGAGGLATTHQAGGAVITATAGAVSGQATLHVTSAVLTGLTIAPADARVPMGLTQQLVATAHFSDGGAVDASAQSTWTSGSPGVATVAPGGLVATVGQGTTTVSAQLGALSASTSLTVTPAALASIAVTPAAPRFPAGLTRPFTATGRYTDGTSLDLTATATWTSETPAVAVVAAGGTVTTVAPGTSTIAATQDGVAGGTLLTVTTATLVRVDVSPPGPSLTTSTGVQLAATGTYGDGSTHDLTTLAAWSSGSPGVASVSAGGLAIGLAPGTSLVTATFGGVAGSTSVLVVAPGAIWTTRAAAPRVGVALYGVAAGPDRVVAVGKVDIESSPDGLSWAHHDAAGILNGVTAAGAGFAAVGWFENTLTELAQASTDGLSWSTSTWTTGALQPAFGVAWSGSAFVAVGYAGAVTTSPDGGGWTPRSSGTGAWLHRVAWSGGLFVAVGDGGTILTSPDGASWTGRTSGTGANLNGVTWDGARFLAVGGGGTILASVDGVTWTPSDSGTLASLNGVAASAAGYVAVGDGGAVVTSADGLTWSPGTSGTTLPLNDVAWTGTRFVAVGGLTSGIILTSP